ncbi:PREDICTED: uncharacterized protein LOC108561810 [Nicrophorus vespilloides]|uniref:WW domain binding protein VOPP1 n=1 Tax=Nicrophorus vespilloides TaxID=110193 RepID=A0ABM1MLC0_NICVS|nr:PREDICTED: uncharacterized protein LOC108561810 [Nicrophorus vespilloides]XP_017775370.1 PREDICTED: uncharacterized protein LOC108561810 [Nicrophorus vespilloides]
MTSVRICDGGHICHPPKDCCRQGCCYPEEMPIYKTTTMPTSSEQQFVGHWYFWVAITTTFVGILCACSLWRRHSSNFALFCCRDYGRDERASEPDSNGSCYVPPQYSRCSSFHQAPPPYAEVTSKPDLYPLVISYNGDAVVKSNGSSTGYLMVQYFRNFIVRPVGSLSATSTIDSLSSSFICNASNEANTVIPPPYSCTGSLEEVNHHHKQNCTFASSPTPPTAIVTPTITPPPPPPLPPSSMSRTHSNLCSRSSSANQLKTVPEVGESAATTAPPKPQVPATPARFSRKLIFNKAKTHSADSESGGEEHNFSDLLNLSVCLPSGSITTQLAATQSNPQMTDMIQSYSVTNSMTSSDISSLANLGTPDSPPRATSPTIEMRELLDKIQQLPQHKSPIPEQLQHQQQQPQKKYFSRSKAKTLYMPLHHDPHQQHHNHHQQQSIKSGGGILKTTKGWLSRSAPNTPCGTFVPNFPRNPSSQRGSKSKICCDGSPLLTNDEHDESDDERAHRDECL